MFTSGYWATADSRALRMSTKTTTADARSLQYNLQQNQRIILFKLFFHGILLVGLFLKTQTYCVEYFITTKESIKKEHKQRDNAEMSVFRLVRRSS